MKVRVMMRHICFIMRYTNSIILTIAISASQLRIDRKFYWVNASSYISVKIRLQVTMVVTNVVS